MKRPVLSIFACALLASCGSPSTSLSHIAQSSQETASRSSSPAASGDLTPPTAEDFVPRYLDRIAGFDSYKMVTYGSTKAVTSILTDVQTIEATFLKDGDYGYMKSSSSSKHMGTYHQAYFHGEKAIYRGNESSQYTAVTLNEYLASFGTYPFDRSILGYLCGEGCILKVEPIERQEGYAFKITFDNEKATNNVRIQMKTIGDLEDYAVFSSVVLSVYVKEDLTPEHIDVLTDYRVKKILNSSCHQDYRVDYSDFNEAVEIPDLAEVQAQYSI